MSMGCTTDGKRSRNTFLTSRQVQPNEALQLAPSLYFVRSAQLSAGVLLGAGIFLVHRQIERRIDQIGKL